MSDLFVNIVGGGLAGSEAAYQLARAGINVRLFEMRPQKLTPAHQTGNLAELVCSNTFKSLGAHSAPGILKAELQLLGSLVIESAFKARVPAGEALAVDREVFSREVENGLVSTRRVERISMQVENVTDLPSAYATILATGPLTQGGLANFMRGLVGSDGLYFYDAIAPVIDFSSIDMQKVFSASRYGKGGEDYLNCPMSKDEYLKFYEALMTAEKMEFQDFEEAKYFQGCQPIEAIAETGVDSLRFGPMKPVGLTDPNTGKRAYAVVQLRIDNLSRTAYNMVGFQTKLKYPEQKRVFSLIPGLENAEFLRLGSMHRNTYICSPEILDKNFSLKTQKDIRFAGQITGVEGYTESTAIGLLAAKALLCEINNTKWELPPRASALGSLCYYLFNTNAKDFQPINTHFGLFDLEGYSFASSLPKKYDKKEARTRMGVESQANIKKWLELYKR